MQGESASTARPSGTRGPKDQHSYFTKGVCSECSTLVDGEVVYRGEAVILIVHCSEHGQTEAVISSSRKHHEKGLLLDKPGKRAKHYRSSVDNGCPSDCGLCPDHRQHTCVGIIEITGECQLECPVCFADSSSDGHLSLRSVKGMIDAFVECEDEPEVLQISGGEPTLHPDILDILEYAGEKGIRFPMLNTNGVKLANRSFTDALASTMDSDLPIGVPMIYLQFDGLSDEVYLKLRGEALLDVKWRAIENCRRSGLDVVLVPTLVRGVNDDEIGGIIDLALKDQCIKGVSFQPVARTGRFEVDWEGAMTIPEVLDRIEEGTSGKLRRGSFINVPCPHPSCSVCTYVYSSDKGAFALTDLFDMSLYMEYITNKAVPYGSIDNDVVGAIDTLLSMSAVVSSDRAKGALCTSCGASLPEIAGLLDRVTLISVHSFMDATTFDLERARKCCVTEVLPDGRMVPFCIYNVLRRNEDGIEG